MTNDDDGQNSNINRSKVIFTALNILLGAGAFWLIAYEGDYLVQKKLHDILHALEFAVAISINGGLAGAFTYWILWFRARETTLSPLITTHRELISRLQNAVESVQNSAVLLRGDIRIMSNDDMGRYELETKTTEIWLTSPDLHREIIPIHRNGQRTYEPNEFVLKNISGKNIHRQHVVYKFFAPANRPKPPGSDMFMEVYKPALNKNVHFYFLSDEVWMKMPYRDADMIIFNPVARNTRWGILDQNIYTEVLGKARGFWIEADPQLAQNWIQIISSIEASERSSRQ